MELYASENNFNIFYEKKRRELKNLQQLNEFVKPAPYFVYFMFKDTIHVDDYGSIKETLFKFPSMTRVSAFNLSVHGKTLFCRFKLTSNDRSLLQPPLCTLYRALRQ